MRPGLSCLISYFVTAMNAIFYFAESFLTLHAENPSISSLPTSTGHMNSVIPFFIILTVGVATSMSPCTLSKGLKWISMQPLKIMTPLCT